MLRIRHEWGKKPFMGGHDAWRNFLFVLFGEYFHTSLPENTHIDMCLIDMMQFTASLKHLSPDRLFNVAEVSQRMVRIVQGYANEENDARRPIIDKALVVLFDTPKNVPKTKTTTQKSRDTTIEASPVVLNDEMYAKLLRSLGVEDRGNLLLHRETVPLPSSVLRPETVWRSNNLRWQFDGALATAMLRNVKLAKPKVLIVDDAVVFSNSEAYRKAREAILEDFNFHDKPAFEQETLIAFLINHTMTQRYVRYHDETFARLDPSGIGEADIKIPSYIRYDADDNMHRYMVVSQDTDLLFILLLHMKRLVDTPTTVWLDTQTPHDRHEGTSSAYRYIDVGGLYRAIIRLFHKEYPTITHPIETLLFLVQCLNTDFTSRMGHKYLGVTRRKVWNIFSELHHPRSKNNNDDDGYILFAAPPSEKKKKSATSAKRERCKTYHYSNKMHNVLGSILMDNRFISHAAIQSIESMPSDDSIPKIHEIELDMSRCEQFFYFVCQQQLIDDMSLLKMHPPQGTAMHTPSSGRGAIKPFYEDPASLFIHANDIIQSVAKFKEKSSGEHDSTIKSVYERSLKHLIDDCIDTDVVVITHNAPPSPTKKKNNNTVIITDKASKAANFADIGAAVSFTPKEKASDTAGLARLAKRKIPANYSIPSRTGMRGRLCRLSWVLNYLQNAPVCNHFAECYGEVSALDSALCKFGWRKRVLPVSAVNVNTSYYGQELGCVVLGDMPIVTVEIEESDSLFQAC